MNSRKIYGKFLWSTLSRLLKLSCLNRLQDKLLVDVRNYRPRRDLVHQIRILLLGPTGAGKSSFFNSVKSVFRGHVTHQALVGSDTTGVSDKVCPFKITQPLLLCSSSLVLKSLLLIHFIPCRLYLHLQLKICSLKIAFFSSVVQDIFH